MKNELKQYTVLDALYLPDDTEIAVSSEHIASISINMEKGQMSEVPFVKVVYNDGKIVMYNVAYVASMRLKKSANQ